MKVICLSLLLLLCSCTLVSAQSGDAADDGYEPVYISEMFGMVVDDTRSRVGYIFYEAFYRAFRAPENAPAYKIVIRDQPWQANRVRLSLLFNDELLVDQVISHRTSDVEEFAERVAVYIAGLLQPR